MPERARRRASEVPLPRLELSEVPGVGPEDVALDSEGRRVTGLADGRVLRLAAGRDPELLADTGGRPLGVEVLPDGGVLVSDASRGLLRVDATTGDVDVLAEGAGGRRVRLCDNAGVAPDGTVYFSDSSQRFDLEHWKADLLEHSGTGRLLALRPSGAVEVVLDGLHFANGVTVPADGAFVVVAETGAYRLTRHWLTGPLRGTTDVLVDNLPGFPDNVSTGTDGLVWVALPSPRNAVLDALLPRPPALRRLSWALPERLQPQPVRTVWVQAYDVHGRLVHDLQGTHPHLHMVTGVREHDGVVHLGSLTSSAVASFRLPG